METDDSMLNEQQPYLAPRTTLFYWLKQAVIAPSGGQAITIIAQRGMGKSTFLQQFAADTDRLLIGVYIALEPESLSDDDRWLGVLVKAITHALDTNGFGLSRLPETPTDNLMDWFESDFLTEVFRIIRPHRHLIWLLDNAEHLTANGLDAAGIGYLQDLLANQTQLKIVVAVNTAYEDQLQGLGELVNPATTQRLRRFTFEESSQFIQQITPFPLDETTLTTLHDASGGFPQLLQTFAEKFATVDTRPTKEQLKALVLQIYQQFQDDFRARWQDLEQDERLVLTAVSSILYARPQQEIKPADIEKWLVETDYQLTLSAIHAALRSLDFRELISHDADGVQFTSSLMQRWLVQNARLDKTAIEGKAVAERVQPVLILFALIVLALLIAFLWLGSTGGFDLGEPNLPDAPPTVTLDSAS